MYCTDDLLYILRFTDRRLRLRESGTLTDCKITIDGESKPEWQVHRLVLAMHSPILLEHCKSDDMGVMRLHGDIAPEAERLHEPQTEECRLDIPPTCRARVENFISYLYGLDYHGRPEDIIGEVFLYSLASQHRIAGLMALSLKKFEAKLPMWDSAFAKEVTNRWRIHDVVTAVYSRHIRPMCSLVAKQLVSSGFLEEGTALRPRVPGLIAAWPQLGVDVIKEFTKRENERREG